ncbi:aldehyde dehydrogenase family protein, partial [Alkalihalophilus lindianensis]
MEDADVARAAAVAAQARCQNNGQSCIAAKRFVVVDAAYDAFAAAFVREMESLRVGDPLDAATQVGPLARADLRDTLDEQVHRAVQQGA